MRTVGVDRLQEAGNEPPRALLATLLPKGIVVLRMGTSGRCLTVALLTGVRVVLCVTAVLRQRTWPKKRLRIRSRGNLVGADRAVTILGRSRKFFIGKSF